MPSPPYQAGGDAAGALNAKIPAGAAYDRLAVAGDVAPVITPSVAVYTAFPRDPTWDIRLEGSHVAYYRAPATIRVGVPVYEDAPLIVYDPATRPTSELRIWRAVINPAAHTIDCQGYGLFDSSACGSGLPLFGWGTGSGLSSDAGLIRGWELRAVCQDRKRIAHALRLHGPVSALYRLPARKSDQTRVGGLPMGSRLQLPMTDKEIMERRAPGNETVFNRLLHGILFAARDYGIVCLDGSADWTIPIEHGCSDPYVDELIRQSPSGYLSYATRQTRDPKVGVPWDRLRVLARGV